MVLNSSSFIRRLLSVFFWSQKLRKLLKPIGRKSSIDVRADVFIGTYMAFVKKVGSSFYTSWRGLAVLLILIGGNAKALRPR